MLVAATPDAYRELALAEVLEGRCWTSPTLASGRLYLRNREELLALDMVNPPPAPAAKATAESAR